MTQYPDSVHTGKRLVWGYQCTRIQNNQICERLYFVTPTGETYRTAYWLEFNNAFNTSVRQWEQCAGLPDDAEFIGNYPSPV